MDTGEQAIHDALVAEPGVQVALLFGSRARADARPDSDWDVAVFVDSACDAACRWQLRTRLAAALAPSVQADIVILNDAPPLLAHRALQGRMLLRRDHGAFTQFFVKTLAEAGDEHYWSALHARAREQRRSLSAAMCRSTRWWIECSIGSLQAAQ